MKIAARFVPLLFLPALALGSPPLARAERAESFCRFQCTWVPPEGQMRFDLGRASGDALPLRGNRLLSWNVFKGGKEGFAQTFQDVLRRARPNLLALQEATLTPAVRPSLESVEGFGWVLGASFLLKGGFPTGVAVGAPVPAVSIRFHRTPDLEPLARTPKTTLLMELPIEGSSETLLLANIHAINIREDRAFERQIRAVTGAFATHRGPIVFVGDFNVWNRDRERTLRELAGAHGLTRAPWVTETHGLPDRTDPSFRIQKADWSGRQLDDAYTRGIDILTAQVWSEGVQEAGSDHPALFLEFDFPRR